MTFQIELGPKAQKSLDKLPEHVGLRIIDKLESVKENPFRYLEHYEGDNCFKLRIGDYRALIDADFKNKKLIVRILDKRGRIYKR
jgi:mRNA-degrading endonuclease RelE of RelBE toxin-antitoxin system